MTADAIVSFRPAAVWRRKVEYKLRGRVSLFPSGTCRGMVLLSYVVQPFIVTRAEFERTTHTNPVECLEIAEAFLRRGYAVDVVPWTDANFVPKKPYAFVVDIHGALERLSRVLPANCVKLFYITGAHWLFQNQAEYARLLDVQRRQGVTLLPRRTVSPSKNIECADHVFGLGNAFVHGTYAYAAKPIHRLPLPAVVSFAEPVPKPVEAGKRFMWIGGGGAVHKGLDLVLEAFRLLPKDFELTICGPVPAEQDFVELYRRDLQETPNIRTVGRIDVRGSQFRALAEEAAALIYPSCSEGTPGSVVTAMHAGLIPIVSREAGIDVEGFGVQLAESSVEAIVRALQDVAALSQDERAERSHRAWEQARFTYTRAAFREHLDAFLMTLIPSIPS